MKIQAVNLSKTFNSGIRTVHAVVEASIVIHQGETVGLLGNSGSGKTTLGQMLAGLQKPTKGTIIVDEENMVFPYRGENRRRIQLLFQQPEVAFDPCRTLRYSMREVYGIAGIPYSQELLQTYLARYGLYEEHLDRYPSELSGGELQRAALARILLLKPELIILDEPTSMLDSISQAQIIRLLQKTQKECGTSYLFISHNQALTKQFCHRVYFMENGIIKEDDMEGVYGTDVRNTEGAYKKGERINGTKKL